MKIKIDNNKTIWVTSDLHLGHKNVIKYSNRPFANDIEMDEALIRNWNEKVQPNDIVFNLGDFCFSNDRRIVQVLEQLNGTQYFLFGNHDRNMTRRRVKDYCRETGKIRLFADVFELRYKGESIFMSHYSHRVWNKSHHGALHLYGHSHGSLPGLGRSVDVGVDSQELNTNYAPILLDNVIAYLKTKDVHSLDHH